MESVLRNQNSASGHYTEPKREKEKRKEVFEFEQQTLTSGHHELAPCQAYHRREASEDHCSLATTEVVD